MDDDVTATTPELIDMISARFETVARMGTGEADTVLFRTSMAAGKVVPLHSHIDPECFYILSGRIDVFVGHYKPGWHAVETGCSLLVANGVKHAVRNPANQPADMILATNTRLARFFREAGRSVTPGAALSPPTPEDIQRVLRVAETYGYWFASPSQSAAIIA